MKRFLCLLAILVAACKSSEEEKLTQLDYSEVEVQTLMEDSISIRAIEVMGGAIGFAGSNGYYGLYNTREAKVRMTRQRYDSVYPEFRAVAATSRDFFMLSVADPALLYKTGPNGKMELVYKEEGEAVFYDSMTFWNDLEGIAMGDPVNGCLSVIITRDGGKTWKKIPCDQLPKTVVGEAAFAASDTNLEVVGDHTWIISGGIRSRVFHSPDKGRTWEVFETPIIEGSATTGAYSMDFYDTENGIIIGGDYTNPAGNNANKAITADGGKTWELVGEGKDPGYKSCVQYIPGGHAKAVVTVGFTGISFSADAGKTWKKLSEEPFYSIRFVNDSTAYAAGKNRLAKLIFR